MKFRNILRAVFRPFFLLFWGLKAEGLENIPSEGPFIIAGNHIHFDDPIMHGMAVRREFHIMAKAELMKNPVIGFLLRSLGAFAVVRGTADISALDRAGDVLKNGSGLLIFPEGTRSRTGKLGKLKNGTAYIAGKNGAPVIPAARIKRRRLLFFPAVTIRYGKPIRPDEISEDIMTPAGRREFTEVLTKEIEKLIDKE